VVRSPNLRVQEAFQQGYTAALEQCRGEESLLLQALHQAQRELERVQANAEACAGIAERQARVARWDARAKAAELESRGTQV